MPDANPNVVIIDDDPEFRDSVGRLLRSVGLETRQFSSVTDFFACRLFGRPDLPGARRENAGVIQDVDARD
jgi:FixJ family two-component response regulator